MQCFAEILSIEDNYAVVSINEETWNLPLGILPENSRPGDIIQLQAGFCPFQTLDRMK
ncbi:MAG TPA: DUF3006 domain-containing protein [Clostridiales bacterium]|nr:DUF3006 domain-containing protein [Clostridiales bacterium]